MSLYMLKSLIASVLLLAGILAAFSMLALMGRAGTKADPARYRRLHRAAGYVFAAVLIVLVVIGGYLFIETGDALSLRGVLHAFLALSLFFLFLLKWLLVRFYKSFLRMAPALGMSLLVLTFIVFSVSGGYFLLRAAFSPGEGEAGSTSSLPAFENRAEQGALLYAQQCASCHYADREDSKLGPGLKDLFKKSALPYSGKSVTEENVRRQLIRPALSMPSFARMTEPEIADLMAYLKGL